MARLGRLGRVARLTVAAACVLAALVTGRVPVSAGSAARAVISLGLERQAALLAPSGFLRDQQARSVHLEIAATRDVSSAIRALGGQVEATTVSSSGAQGAPLGQSWRTIAATLPASALAQLAAVPGVRALFPAQRLHLDLDRSVPEIRANEAWTLKDAQGLPVQGEHVLIGVIDSGIDYRNPDFRNSNGSTRIVAIWDQTHNGKPPAGFTFGYECHQTSINRGTCPERDTDGHGTHVAGIAAGNGRSSSPAREIGVAPRADLIVVKTDLLTDHILAAWKYLIERAQARHEPIVINNSFGGMLSPHDGSAPDSQALDQLGGPGRIFVVAAGNEGSKAMHADGTLRPGGSADLSFDAPGIAPEVTISAFYPARDDVTATLTDLDTGQTFGPVKQDGVLGAAAGEDGDVHVSMQSGSWNAHFHELDLDLSSTSDSSISGRYRLTLQAASNGSEDRFDAWIADDDSARFDSPDGSDTIGDPAEARTAISVGNYVTRTDWTGADGQSHNVCDYYICNNGTMQIGDIKPSSSTGPTADGRQKPDISAPGTMIISSLSANAPRCSGDATDGCLDPAFITPDEKNYVASGTSMSAPHVAGVVALMLQADPWLDPAAVDSILRSTARHDQFTGNAAWTPTFGAGKVDAYAAVKAALAARASAPSFSFLSLRPERVNAQPDWLFHSPPLSRVPVGRALYLSMYVRFGNVTARTGATFAWTVRRRAPSGPRSQAPASRSQATVVARRTRDVSLTGDGPVRESWRYTPRQPGTYSILAAVTLDGVQQVKSARLTVQASK